MNCILIDKKLGVYFVAPKLHSSRQSAAAILPVERAILINEAANNRYNIQLVERTIVYGMPIIVSDPMPIFQFGKDKCHTSK